MDKSLVSVIITCYNQESYLAEALESVLNQTYPLWECIIMNDGSTDQSEKIAKQYVCKDPRFVYISQSNQGVVAARNHAIKSSKGKYILPLDGDDTIEPQYLELATRLLDLDNELMLVYCDVRKFGAESGILPLAEMNTRNILRSGCCVSTSMYRKEVYERIGGYKEEMRDGWEDWEFFISLMESGGKVQKINKVLFNYRFIDDSRDRAITDKNCGILKSKLVRLHPTLYFHEYESLLSDYEAITQSSMGKIYIRIQDLIHKINGIIRKKVLPRGILTKIE